MSPLLRKELRLVLPAALQVLVVGWLAGQLISRDEQFRTLALLLLMGGAVTVSALGFGQEFAHRTLDFQLAQPVSRTHIWWTKLLALVIALVPIQLLIEHYNLAASAKANLPEWLGHVCFPLTLACVPFYAWKTRSVIGGAVLGASLF